MARLLEREGTTWLHVADVARLLGVSANTVRRWTDAGRIAAYRSPGGHRRYRADDIHALLAGEEIAGAAAHPGDVAELHRQNEDLRAVVQVELDLAGMLAEAPGDVPEHIARRLCDLTGVPRCDVFALDGEYLSLAASIEAGEPETSRLGATWALGDWAPTSPSGNGGLAPVALRADDPKLTPRGRRALQRRGCHTLVWAPMLAHGRLVGALELSDTTSRDLSPRLDLVASLAQICAQALGIDNAYKALEQRDKAMRDFIDLAQEVSQAHELERFVERFARRLLSSVGADCVDVFRVAGGVVRTLISLSRDGIDESVHDTVLDTAKYPSLQPVFVDHVPLVLKDLDDPRLTPDEIAAYRKWGYASSVSLPLVSGGDMVGLVELYDDAERDWSADVGYLTGVSQFVAGLFDNAMLLEEVRQRERLQTELVALARRIAHEESQSAIAREAAQQLLEVTGCADCDIWWLDEGYLRCLVSVDADGVDESVAGKALSLELFPSTAEAVESQRTLVVGSLEDPRVTDFERGDWAEYGFQSMLSLPLVAGDTTIGLIDLFDTRERDYVEVREFVESAGRTIADALRSAGLTADLRRSNSALRELVELGDELTEAIGLEDLARTAAGRLRTILQAEGCDVWQVDGSRMRCLASIDSRGWDAGEIGKENELSDYEAAVGTLAANEPLVIGDLECSGLGESELADYRRHGYRSMVSVPLVADGRPIGLIDIFDTAVRDYSAMLDAIRNVGRLVAGSFENALLVDRLEGGNRDLQVLVDSSMEFGSTLDVDAVLRTVSERILEVSQADMCDVYRLDGDEVEILLSIGGSWDEDPVGLRYPLSDYGLFIEAAETRRPVVTLDMLSDPSLTEMEHAEALKWGYRSTMDVPLASKGEVIGFVTLCNRDPRPFAREGVVVGLAQLASQAIANANLYREREENARRMTLLSEAALELATSLDLHDTLFTTARRLCDAVGVPECEINIIEGDLIRTLIHVTRGEIDGRWDDDVLPLQDAAVTREVMATKRPAVVRSLADPRLTRAFLETVAADEARSWATLPLVVQDRVIGTVELIQRGNERTFVRGELDTAAAICQAAAMAIENAGLFERQQAANREAQLLNEIARRTAASLELEEVVEAAVDALKQLLSFERHSLLLGAGDAVERVISPDPKAETLTGLTTGELGEAFMGALEEKGVLLARLPDDVPLPAGHPSIAGLRSAAIIALPSEAGILGTLNLLSEREDAFAGADTGLLERVGTQLALAIKNAQLYDEIKHMHLGNLKALSSALNAKDYYTLGHAARVAAYTVMLGRELGWSDELLQSIEEAAYLHDIGKISISDRVLLKPGRLNQQEWQQMREHPVFSADIIRPLFPEPLVLAVRHHHERYDGKGYPDGLAGDDIPMLARAMTVVDAYDAMSCRRPYKAALDYDACRAEMERCRGSQFDSQMLDAFSRVLDNIARQRERAEQIATQAAQRIKGELHLRLRSREDEDSPEYRAIADILRDVRDANPPTRFLTTHARIDNKFVIGVDPEEEESRKSHLGDEIFADDELPVILGGERPKVNTVYADEYGVWITGLAPIRDMRGQVAGAVAADLPCLSGDESEELDGADRHSFAAILQTAAARLGRAEIDAITDALTGLYNHRYLHERLGEEIRHCAEAGQQLSILFCDLDHFKGYNDANGHSAGDRVLREAAHLIEQSVRNVDVAGRYGGEEFVVLLVETGREAAVAVAERIRERIRGAGFTANGRPLTVSIGVATYPDDAQRHEELLDKADWAMYLAKRRGRDQVALVES